MKKKNTIITNISEGCVIKSTNGAIFVVMRKTLRIDEINNESDPLFVIEYKHLFKNTNTREGAYISKQDLKYFEIVELANQERIDKLNKLKENDSYEF